MHIPKLMLLFFSCYFLSSSAIGKEEIELFIDLDASKINQEIGSKVYLWENNGTQGNFSPPVGSIPPLVEYAGGVKAVHFVADEQNILTNGPWGSVPESLVQSPVWTMEAWVFQPETVPDRQKSETYLSWTPRENVVATPSARSVCEFRFSAASTIAVEHWGDNLTWIGNSAPPYGVWHHVASTRDRLGRERLYQDGVLVEERSIPLTLNSGGCFTLGGTYNARSSQFEFFYNGYIGKLSVHGGVLSSEEIFAHFKDQSATFGVTASHDSNWLGDGWQNGIEMESGRGMIMESPLPGALILSGKSYELPSLYFDSGEMVLTNNTRISVLSSQRYPQVNIGYPDNQANLIIRSGEFKVSGGGLVAAGGSNSVANISVGGDSEHPALLITEGNGTKIGAGGGRASLWIKDRGAASFPLVSLGINSGSRASVLIDAGGELRTVNPLTGYLYLGHIGGWASVTNAGTLSSIATLYLGEFKDGARGHGELTLLPGSLVEARNICGGNEEAESLLFTDCATLRCTSTANVDFIRTLDSFTFSNAITFDIESATCNAGILSPLVQKEAKTGDFIRKIGPGTLIFSAPNNFSADIHIEEGTVVFEDKSLPTDYAGKIKVSNGAAVCFNMAGGIEKVFEFLDPDFDGTLLIGPQDQNRELDISRFPKMQIGAYQNVTLKKLVPAGNHFVFNSHGLLTYGASFPPGATLVARTMKGGTGLKLTGSSYSIDSLNLESGMLLLAAPGSVGGSGNIILHDQTTLKLECQMPDGFVRDRVILAPDARHTQILLSNNGRNNAVDLSNLPGCFLGADCKMNHGGRITPCGTTCLLGGGYYKDNTGTDIWEGFVPGTIEEKEGQPVTAVLGKKATLNLSHKNRQHYTGGTVVSNNVYLILNDDGLGAVPDHFDEDNVVLDGCFIRFLRNSFSFHANRGIVIGPHGVTLHPWGGREFSVPGGLGGTGPINVTDGGRFKFIGQNNSYNGHIKVDYAPMTIGSGDLFSWVSEGGIEMGSGCLTLDTNFDTVFNDCVSGGGSLLKEGNGILTITRKQTYTGKTEIKAGGICLSGEGALQSRDIYNSGEIILPEGKAIQDVLQIKSLLGRGILRLTGGDYTLDGSLFIEGLVSLSPDVSLSLDDVNSLSANSGVIMDQATLKIPALGTADVDPPGDSWAANGSGVSTNNGVVSLILSREGTLNGGSAFCMKKVLAASKWEAHFTYHPPMPGQRPNGFSFILQRDPRGYSAYGNISPQEIGVEGITPSVGLFCTFEQGASCGWIVNGGKTDISDLSPLSPERGKIDISLSYNGYGLLTAHYVQGSDEVERQIPLNVIDTLGENEAWVGFTGVGNCSQTITDFIVRIEELENAELTWKLNRNASFQTVDGVNVIRLTEDKPNQVGTAFMKKMVDITKPFSFSMVYTMKHYADKPPADGFSISLQREGLEAVGGKGGGLGISGLPSAIGWGISIYNNVKGVNTPCIKFLKNGNFIYDDFVFGESGIDPLGPPLRLTLSYNLQNLVLTLSQGDLSVTAVSRELVDLASYFKADLAYLGITGGTGGLTAEQRFSDFKFNQENENDFKNLILPEVQVSGQSRILFRSAEGVESYSKIGMLTFENGADVNLHSEILLSPGRKVGLFPRIISVKGNASVTTEAQTSFVLGPRIVFSDTGLLTVSGTVEAPAPVILQVPAFEGRRDLIDLSRAPGLTLSNFSLETDCQPPVSLGMKDNIVYALHDNCTILILK